MNNNTTNISQLPQPESTNQQIPQQIPHMQNEEQNKPNNISLNPETINQIVNELHQASLTGSTKLPSRDIPLDNSTITLDPNVQQNKIVQPPNQPNNYIEEENINSIINKNYNNESNINKLDNIFDKIQVPLLISILYFMFQLPTFKAWLNKCIPILYSNDGNYNFNGYVFTSLLFGTTFYFLNNLNTF